MEFCNIDSKERLHNLMNRKCDSIAILGEPIQQSVQVIGMNRTSLVKPYAQVRPGTGKRR